MLAARRILDGDGDAQSAVLSAMGVPAAALRAFDDAAAEDGVSIWPENWDGLRTFLAMSTQWRSAPMGGATGLDYAALPVVMEYVGVDDRRQAFEVVAELEAETLKFLRTRRG